MRSGVVPEEGEGGDQGRGEGGADARGAVARAASGRDHGGREQGEREQDWWAAPLLAALREALALCGVIDTALPVLRHLHALQLSPEAWSCIDSLLGLRFHETGNKQQRCGAGAADSSDSDAGSDGAGGGAGGGSAGGEGLCCFDSEPTIGQLLDSPLLRVSKHRELAMGLSSVVSDWLCLD